MNKLIFLLTGILMLSSCSLLHKEKGLEGSRPNIILVITDDQGYANISSLGHPVLRTPNLDALHEMSTRFTSFHVSPTCAPTRSAMMSGRHEFKNGVTHTILERERMSLETTTFVEIIKEAGYTTGIFGKWHLGDEKPYQPGNRGFDEVFIHGAGGMGQAYDCSCADFPPNGIEDGRYFDPVINHNGLAVKTKGFCTDVFFKQALDWIKSCRDREEPFFAYITTNAPHSPMIAPEKYKKRFSELGYNDRLIGYYGMIENIDDNMGLLMDKMKEWGLEENTLLIFISDNGPAMGNEIYNAGLNGKKGTPYDGGTKVPSFWYWKGNLASGRDIDRMAAHIDFFPTFLALTGAEMPENIQKIEGRNLLPLLENQEADWEDRYLFIHRGRWTSGEDPDLAKYDSCAVRSQRFKLMNNVRLFDLLQDPGETRNVIDSFPDVVAEMRKAYDLWWEETKPLMVNEDVPLSSVRPYYEMYYKQEKEQGIPDWEEPGL